MEPGLKKIVKWEIIRVASPFPTRLFDWMLDRGPA